MKDQTRKDWIAKVAANNPRKDLLFLLRWKGFAAHKLKTNEQLADLLWQANHSREIRVPTP